MKFKKKQEENQTKKAVIKVIGLGGGGGNAVNHMAKKSENNDVEFICANTDAQHLSDLEVDKTICIGYKSTTKGLGADLKVEIGEKAAVEDKEAIKEAISGADMLFIVVGIGGGTGTGSAPIVANIAKELGILTVAIVTKPFYFEGPRKMAVANEGIQSLINEVDSLIILPNDNLLDSLTEKESKDLKVVFACSDDVLFNSVTSITELITNPGHINLDFADVRTVMSIPGKAMISSGVSSGENRVENAVGSALSNLLIAGINLRNAKGILVNITASKITMPELALVGISIEPYASDDSEVKIGTSTCETMGDSIKVTIVATGLGLLTLQNLVNGKNATIEQSIIKVLGKQINAEKTIHNKIEQVKNVRLVCKENTPINKIAKLVEGLSELYKTVEGDELIVSMPKKTKY